jgi:hypothetical protein
VITIAKWPAMVTSSWSQVPIRAVDAEVRSNHARIESRPTTAAAPGGVTRPVGAKNRANPAAPSEAVASVHLLWKAATLSLALGGGAVPACAAPTVETKAPAAIAATNVRRG